MVKEINPSLMTQPALPHLTLHFDEVLQRSPIGMVLMGSDGAHESVNAAYCAIFGCTEDEALTRHAGVHSLCQALAQDGEIEFLRRDGSTVHVSARSTWLTGQDGRERRLVYLSDISEHKRLTLEMRGAAAKNQAIISAMSDMVFTSHRDGTYLAVETAHPELLYVPPQKFLGRTVSQTLTPRVAQRFMQAFAQALDLQAVQELSYSLPIGGQERFFEARVAPAGVDTVVTVVRDIGARKHAEAELRIAAAAFECQEGIAVMDAQGRFLRTNLAFSELTGYSPQEAVGKAVDFLKSDKHRGALYQAHWNQARRTGVWQGELWVRSRSGTDFLAQGGLTAVSDEARVVTHYVLNFVDATRRQQQEQQRRLDEAAQRNALVREVHDRIKNNLHAVIALLRKFADQHPGAEYPMNQAISQVQAIALVHGLRGREGSGAVHLLDLARAIAQEIERLWHTPMALEFEARCQDWILVEVESVPIAMVLNELMVNAVRHGGRLHGNVNIALRHLPQPQAVQVTLINRGLLAAERRRSGPRGSGLHLVAALLAPRGARISREQQGEQVITTLELTPPVAYCDPG